MVISLFAINFLSNRSIQVQLFLYPVTVQNGIPQRSIMSVILLLIEINDVTSNLKPTN